MGRSFRAINEDIPVHLQNLGLREWISESKDVLLQDFAIPAKEPRLIT